MFKKLIDLAFQFLSVSEQNWSVVWKYIDGFSTFQKTCMFQNFYWKLIIVSICAEMKLSNFWHFNFGVVDSWYNIKFFVTILGLNHWNVSILSGFWQFLKVLNFQLLMNVNVPILCTISLFLAGFSSLDKSPSLTSPSFLFSFFGWKEG